MLRVIRWIARGALLAALSCGTGGGSEAPLGSSPSRADGIIDPGRAASRQLSLQQDAEEVQQRFSELQRSGGWRTRGYFTAEEHDAIEWLLFRFVTIHRAFWGEIDGLGGLDLALTRESQKPGAHVLALHAGLNLADSSAFLVERFRDDPVAIAKLNEAFSRSEIPAGSYDRLALAVTGAERRQALATAWQLHEHELADPEGSAIAKVGTDPALASVLASLEPLHQRVSRRLAELDVTARPVLNRLDHSRAADAARGSGGRFAAVGYETRALVFTDVSRIKSPATYVIVFSSEQKRALHELLRPGDLILTYTAGYVSSAFIPGVFKHGITYVGLAPQRSAAGLTSASLPRLDGPRAQSFAEDLARDRMPDGTAADLIEAVAEGVKFSNLDQILDTHVNRLLVLRPQLSDAERTAFLAGVFAFVGDPYDFRFDFADASRQVCTEVIYRALDGKGGIEFALTTRAGHPTLSADDVVVAHFATPGTFEVMAFAEEDPSGRGHAARLWQGPEAEAQLSQRMAVGQDTSRTRARSPL